MTNPAESMPGLSQRRVLVFLADWGPTDEFRLYWRSRAASKTWRGTLDWCVRAGWIEWSTPSGEFELTDSGRAVLLRDRGQDSRIRAQFREPSDPYWLDRESRARRSDEPEGAAAP